MKKKGVIYSSMPENNFKHILTATFWLDTRPATLLSIFHSACISFNRPLPRAPFLLLERCCWSLASSAFTSKSTGGTTAVARRLRGQGGKKRRWKPVISVRNGQSWTETRKMISVMPQPEKRPNDSPYLVSFRRIVLNHLRKWQSVGPLLLFYFSFRPGGDEVFLSLDSISIHLVQWIYIHLLLIYSVGRKVKCNIDCYV